MAKKHRDHKLTKKQIRKRRRKRLLIAEVVLLMLLVATLFLWNKFSKIKWDDVGEIEVNDPEIEELLEGYTTFAIFGVDNRSVGDYNSGNSDSIMVISINNDKNEQGKKEVRIMSVFRDSYLDIGDDNLQKCNAAYSRGGAKQSIEMLNRNLDLNIQDYIAVDFKALVDAVDAVGGVEIDITKAEAPILNDYLPEISRVTGKSGSAVSAGYQTLNGAQALAYCRIRYTEGDDFRRAERQRTVLKLLFEKTKNASVLELNDLVNVIFPEVATSLRLSECLALGANMGDYDIVETQGWPINQRTADMGRKGSVDVPCVLESNVILAHQFLYQDFEYVPTETVKNISDKIRTNTGYDENDAIDYITWNK